MSVLNLTPGEANDLADLLDEFLKRNPETAPAVSEYWKEISKKLHDFAGPGQHAEPSN